MYAVPLAGGGRAVVFLNLHTTGGQYLTSNITVYWGQLGLPAGRSALVRDLFAEQDLGEHTGSFTAAVQAHDVVVVRIMPVGGVQGDTWRPWHSQPIYEANGGERTARQAGARAGAGALAAGRRMGPADRQHAMFGDAA